jgi:hypothetical protein
MLGLPDMSKLEYRFYALTFPTEFSVDQAIDFFDTVSGSLDRGSVVRPPQTMVLETWSDKFGIKHRLGIPWEHVELESHLRGHVTGIHIEENERDHFPDWTHVVEIGVSDGTRPFNIPRVESQVQRIFNALIAELKPDDTLVIQLVVSPAKRITPPSTTKPVSTSSWALKALWRGTEADRDEIAERRVNAAQTQFRVVLRVGAAASTVPHAEKLVNNIKKAFKVVETPSVYFTNQWMSKSTKRKQRLNRASNMSVPVNFINATELLAFSGWPLGVSSFPGLTQGRTRYLPPNETIEREGRVLGLASASGYETRRIAITPEGGTRHTYVIGASGLGKTVLLGNSLQQDIEQGHGAIVFDGKGDLIERGLDAVPRERLNDVVYMNFADHEYPVGFNILQEGDPRSIVDDLMSLFLHNAGGDIYLREILYHGLHTMRSIPGLTVVDLLPFLAPTTPREEAWREFVLSQLPPNGQLAAYWKSHYALKPNEQLQKIRPVQNRLWQLTNRTDLRNMLGQSHSTISVSEILSENKILFVAIPQNLGSETVSLLGAVMFDVIWKQVQALNMKRPTYMYIDEVQRFLNLPIDLSDMLSVARSKNFGITMAHQYTEQLPRDLFAAVTNASTKIAFKLEGPDAGRMQNIFGKAVVPEDFINLTPYEVMARVATPGGSSAPTTIKTLPPLEGHGLADEVVRRSRRSYARRADEVDREISKRRSAPDRPKRARPSFGDRVVGGDDE